MYNRICVRDKYPQIFRERYIYIFFIKEVIRINISVYKKKKKSFAATNICLNYKSHILRKFYITLFSNLFF